MTLLKANISKTRHKMTLLAANMSKTHRNMTLLKANMSETRTFSVFFEGAFKKDGKHVVKLHFWNQHVKNYAF